MMALVEVVRGELDDRRQTVATARAFAEAVGKTPITTKDSPGFVVNRILFPMINEAAHAYAEDVASAEDIDTGMKLGTNWPMGPLALADLVGSTPPGPSSRRSSARLGDARYHAARRSSSEKTRRQDGAQERRRLLRLREVTRP